MKKNMKLLLSVLLFISFGFADILITELTDPQNSSDAGRYVELYNNGSSDIDFSTGWAIQRWTNGNTDPQSPTLLTGTISAGGFYIICNDEDKYNTTFGLTCDQDIGTGGSSDSNGDDNIALLDASNIIIDMFGVAGEDGSGTGHEFEDGRAERAASNTSSSDTWNENGWNIDNDSGGGDGPQYAPENYDPGVWIGASDIIILQCEDETACNFMEDGDCVYTSDCNGECGGTAVEDCNGECGGAAVIDECGECDGDGTSCAEPAANLYFSEYAEGSSNNKYLEIFNASEENIDLSGYSLSSCSNGCDDWEYTYSFAEGAIVNAGDVYVVCHSSSDEAGIIPHCDETRTLYHNGDDTQGLLHILSNSVLDIIGTFGDDPGSGWNVAGISNATKDHTLVRKSNVTSGNIDWAVSAGTNAEDSEWVVLDQDTWDYIGSHPHDFSTSGCTDTSACNYDENATSDDGSCAYNDCNGECGGSAVEDDCGICAGDGSSCAVYVTFHIDMNLEGVVGDIKLRTSTINGEYNPSEWYVMDDSDGDLIYSYTLDLAAGVTYGYNFNNSDGNGYESGGNLGGCAGGNYGNDRYVTPENTDLILDAVCWESCDSCPETIPGCMDQEALNYDETATEDDGSCIYDWPEAANLFFSEYAEGSSNNKYLEIFNASEENIDLSEYSLSSCSNGCDDASSFDYLDNVTFEIGTTIAAGDVYVICHQSSNEFILAECDQTFTYLSNGDDFFALTQIGSGQILDVIGTFGDDPGSGWDVAGISNATKDHTLIRKSNVTSGNIDWAVSAGTNADDSEWVVLDQDNWNNLGSHTLEDNTSCIAGDVNNDGLINVQDIVVIVNAIINNNTNDLECGDYNEDSIVNVLDIVAIASDVLNPRYNLDDATSAKIIKFNNKLSLFADGFIGAIQMTLKHDNNFSIKLNENAWISDYKTNNNQTTIVMVEPNSNQLFTTNGAFKIVDILVANSKTKISTSIINKFELSNIYPNPFNPKTNINLLVPEASHVSIDIYNILGQKIATLTNQFLEPNLYHFSWDASNEPSGVYFVKMQTGDLIANQKIILMK